MTEFRTKQEKRGIKTRQKRKIILIGCEGNNKTEKNYFSSFNNIQKEYKIEFSRGNYTDLDNIVKNIKSTENIIGFDKKIDKSFVIFDLDNDISKVKNLHKLESNKKYSDIKYIASNPCFEFWYLLHFVYTTKLFSTGDELITELKKHIINYEKNTNYFDILYPYIRKAIESVYFGHSLPGISAIVGHHIVA